MKKLGKVNFIIPITAFTKNSVKANGTVQATELYQLCLTLIMLRNQIWLWAKCLTNRAVGQAIRRTIIHSRSFTITNLTTLKDSAQALRATLLTKQKTVIVAVSEGIHDADGNYISSDSAVADKFGHAQLSGAGKALEYLVRDEIGVKVRSIELNVLQRCAGHIASRTDITESFSLGQAAVKYAAEGKTGIMAAIERISNDPYQWVIKSADVADIANEAKSVPVEWINEAGNDVTDEMIDYLRPLIIGEVSLQYKDGLPVYLPVDHLLH